MNRQITIERTLRVIHQLTEEKADEISDFAEFLYKRYEEYGLLNNIQKLVSESQTFAFLNTEEDIYSTKDSPALNISAPI